MHTSSTSLLRPKCPFIVLLLKFHYISLLLSFWCHSYAVYKCHRNVAGISGFTIASNEVPTRLFTQSILCMKVLHHMWASFTKKALWNTENHAHYSKYAPTFMQFPYLYKSSLAFSWSGTFECRNFFKRLTYFVVFTSDNFVFLLFLLWSFV